MPKSSRMLHLAKVNKLDEFYTQISDIERELKSYRNHFKNATIFCNCDDPEYSNFWRYFHINFKLLGLKKLITTHYDAFKSTYKMEYEGGNDDDYSVGTTTLLKTNGDFRSPECVELMKQVDIVVTNPPFSLFREYVGQLMYYHKKFLIIGNINAITYKEIFPLIVANKVWLGTGMGRWISGFIVPETYELYGTEARINEKGQRIISTNNCIWLTNLDHLKRHEPIDLVEHYTPAKFPKYENCDAIEVSRTLDIPEDYYGMMGVPISFLDKFCPDQFIILGLDKDFTSDRKRGIIDGKQRYARIMIKRKEGESSAHRTYKH